MDDASEIPELFTAAVNALTRNHVTVEGIIADVDADPSSETAYTCSVTVGKTDTSPGSTFFNVPLKVLIGKRASVIEIPVVGTDCLLKFLDGDLQRPQLDKVDQTDTFQINCGHVIYNDGNLGGMVKAKELQTQSDKDKSILQAFLDLVNGPPVDEPGNGAPSAFQAALKAALAGLTPGTWDNLENPLITQ